MKNIGQFLALTSFLKLSFRIRHIEILYNMDVNLEIFQKQMSMASTWAK